MLENFQVGTYDKPALPIKDQIARLQTRGLLIDDVAHACHCLEHIGYYRLSAYWLPFEQATDGTSRNHQFLPGTTFQQIFDLYIFDRELRLLVMEAIERIEISVRALWVNAIANAHGPHAYMNVALFNDPWSHASNIARLSRELKDSREIFVEHYRERYDTPFLPPVWAMAETLSFGALSLWVKATRDTKIKKEISRRLGLPTVEIMESVLHAMTLVRNICAHHGRLWNRKFPLQLPRIKRLPDMVVDPKDHQPSRQLFNYLLVIATLMHQINPGSSWPRRVREHILSATPQQRHSMGFHGEWEHGKAWQ